MNKPISFSCRRFDARRWIHQAGRAMAGPLALAMGLALSACDKKPVEQAAPAAPPMVVVAKVQKEDVVPYHILTGTLSANQTVTILPRVNAFVDDIPFKPGEFLKAGAVLFKLDDKPFTSQLEQAKATVLVRKADLDLKKADLKAQEAARDNAKDEKDRQERLEKQQATNEKDLLLARNNYRAAVAAVESANAAITAATADVVAAEAAVGVAQVNVDYCTIKSPITGKVDTNAVNKGDLVSSSNTKPLTTVREIDPILVDFSYPENLIVDWVKKHPIDPNRKLAIPVKISLGTENDFRFAATVNFVSNTMDAATGTIPAQAVAENKDLRLYPGLFVRVKMEVDPIKGAIMVQQAAIGRDIGGPFVWVVKPDNTAEKRYVKIGAEIENRQVVTSGLTADEQYIVQGMQRARDRGKVTPKSAAPATQPSK